LNLVKTLIFYLLLILCFKASYGQIDSILDKTWIGIDGDAFKLWKSEKYNKRIVYQEDTHFRLNFNVNYRPVEEWGEWVYYKCKTFSDSTLTLLKGYRHYRDYPNPANVKFKYFGDSIKIYPNSQLQKILDRPNNVRITGGRLKNDTAIFYDSTFFFKSITLFDSLVIINSQYSPSRIRLSSNGSLEVFFSSVENSPTDSIGLHFTELNQSQVLQLCRWMHIAHFDYWESSNCTHSFPYYYTIYYPEKTYNLEYDCPPWRNHGTQLEFMVFLAELIETSTFKLKHFPK